MEHFIHGSLLQKPVEVTVVGAGGTGSQIITGLAQLDRAMRALGHPGGLQVRVIDDDTVSEANVGRQMFWPSDVGLPKAEVLVHRINMAMGMNWQAEVGRLTSKDRLPSDIVLGCVDNRASRQAILGAAKPGTYWLDMGNRADDGQCVLGEIKPKHGEDSVDRLPTIDELFPEIVDPSQDGKDDAPSCSLAEALDKQGLFVNRAVALYGLDLLWRLFRYGRISHHGVFFNLASGRTSPLAVDPAAWERMGVVRQTQKKAA